MSQIYSFSTQTARADLSNCDLILLVGCSTAANENNIARACALAGAEYVVGFTTSIDCDEANYWTKQFFNHYSENDSVSSAAYSATEATQSVYGANTEMREYAIHYCNGSIITHPEGE